MKISRFVALALVFWVAAVTSTARADEAGAKTKSQDGDGYGYRFDDDPLQAGGMSLTVPRILVAKHADRQTLIRPRTAFVMEMLKSVESL
jgi:hypothetical protein